MRSEQIKLYNIAECNLYSEEVNSKFKIPNIQRGLVWKSIQMELLWDSILRGFPIGSMLVLDKEGNGEGDILDGQQRANAIITGFNKNEILGDKSPTNILWLDLNYNGSESDKERRRYGIRLTNASHPWGYDENGNILSADNRRDSLRKALGKDYFQRKKSDWDIRQFVPHFFSKKPDFLPIPLAIIVSAAKDKLISSSESIKEFKETVISDIKVFAKYSKQWKELYERKVLEFINNQVDEEFLRPFFELNNYCIIFNFVDNNDDIEILFNRVNSRGTQMTNAELTYAAIKHYGAKLCNCPDIGQIIKKKSEGIMLEQNLAQLLFRYCFSDNNKISGEINASKIREKALLKDAEKDCDIVIINLRKMFSRDSRALDFIIERTKGILLMSPDKDCDQDCKLPNFLLAEIATKKPNLLILLICIIKKQGHLKDQFVQALVFYLYCFTVNNHNEPVSLIFEKVSGCDNIKEETIIDILRDSISREWCDSLILSFDGFPALDEKEFTSSWNHLKYINNRGFSVFEKLFPKTYQGCFMLKYAQRKYYGKYFNDFNPSNKEYWDEINRPWDHDHIIPQNWIPKDGDWRNCIALWINSMGNIADIPYEENRSKSDDANWDYYDSINWDLLHFNKDFRKTSRQSFEQGFGVIRFMNIVKKRFISISNDFLFLLNSLHLENNLSPMQLERKRFLELMHASYFSEYDYYYRNNSGQEVKFDINDTYAWQRPWLSLIKRSEDKYAPSISIYIIRENDTFLLERGHRNIHMVSPSDSWWQDGTWFRRELKLFDKDKISFMATIFCYGDKYYSISKEIRGFVLNSMSLIAYTTNINGIEIIGKMYESYGCYHCSIISADNKTPLPECVVNNNFEGGDSWSKNKLCIDCYLSGREYKIEKVCNIFADLMVELYNLKKKQDE